MRWSLLLPQADGLVFHTLILSTVSTLHTRHLDEIMGKKRVIVGYGGKYNALILPGSLPE